MKKLMKKEKGKMKSVKVWTSLFFTFSLLLFTSAANAAELPEGYTAVEYIVAPRDSYINTGYKPNQDTRVAMDVTVQGAREYWFGAWNVAWNDGAYALGNDNGEVYCGYGSGSSCGGIKVDDKGLPNGRVTVALEKGVVYTNDVVWSNAHRSDATFSVEYNLYLFAQNRKGTAKPGDGQGDIICHGCKIYEDSVVKRDFVPCVRMSDGAVGFYDLAATGADKVFYANDGTGTFAIPPDAFCTVTIGDYPNMTAAYTFGDGSVTNAVNGTSFLVKKGTENVKVIFTAKRNHEIVEGNPVVELEGAVTENVVFGEGNDYAVPTAVCTLGEVPYLDWNDVEKKMTNATLSATDYELMTSETREFADGKWYVIADAVVIDNGANIKVNGSARLILCDDASLTITNVANNMAAIDVSAGGSVTNALTIYGQQGGSGLLSATGGKYGAGIGTAERSETAEGCGVIVINGGTVTATGGSYGAGIGGGYQGAGGTVTINGGTVTALSGDDGAGIGGGDSGAGGTVTINGGIVTAQGGYEGAGIGGGYHGAGGTVSINGGLVTANGGDDGAGIGGGYVGAGGVVMVNGGEVAATGGFDGAGIGGGCNGAGGVVTVNGGIVTATGGQYGAGIGGGRYGADGTVTPGKNVEVIEGAVGNGSSYVKIVNTDEYPIVTIGAFEHMTAAWTSGDGAVTNAVNGTSFFVKKGTENVKVIFAAKWNYEILGDPVVELEGAVTENIVFGVGNDYAVPKVRSVFGDITYLDWDDANRKMTNAILSATDYELVTSETTAFADGKWYVVADTVVIENGSNIKVNGTAHLILCDNASLTVKDVGTDNAAIDVSANVSVTNSLTIYGQQDGSGTVTATGGSYGAGIGGGYQGAGGTVTINGGLVTAQGGYEGAGIGGGNGGAGGTVTINGGAVTATGGNGGAGIGGGMYGADHGKVTFGAGTRLVLAGDSAPGSEVSAADYANDHRAAYAHITPLPTLKIPAGVHYSYVVSNETAGTELKGVLVDGTNTYMVVKGSTVKMYFTLEESYEWDGEFDNPKDLGVIESDKVVDASEMPKAKGIPGSEVNPWSVGEKVTADIKDRVLYLKGSGAMNDFASAADVPWAAVAGEVTAVMIAETVTHVGKNTFAGLENLTSINGEDVKSTYRTVSTVNGKPIEQFNMMEGALGYAPLAYPSESSALPSGAISGAEFDAVQIIDGKAYLDVSVYTSDTLTNQNWSVATNGVIEVPAPGKQGFFILKSKPAVPSNKPFVPPPLPIEQ